MISLFDIILLDEANLSKPKKGYTMKTAKRDYYGDNPKTDETVKMLIEREIYCCDSALVARLCSDMMTGFHWDDMENLIAPNPDYDGDEGEDNSDSEDEHYNQEPLEWWRVSKWACEQLRAVGEPVLDNDYGYWWGRTCSGQSIELDPTWYDIWGNIDA